MKFDKLKPRIVPYRDYKNFPMNHQRCSKIKGVLKNFAKFTGKRLCQSLLFNKVAGLRPTTLLKKRLWHRCFPVNFVKFLKTPFLQKTSGRLLLLLSKLSMENISPFVYGLEEFLGIGVSALDRVVPCKKNIA